MAPGDPDHQIGVVAGADLATECLGQDVENGAFAVEFRPVAAAVTDRMVVTAGADCLGSLAGIAVQAFEPRAAMGLEKRFQVGQGVTLLVGFSAPAAIPPCLETTFRRAEGRSGRPGQDSELRGATTCCGDQSEPLGNATDLRVVTGTDLVVEEAGDAILDRRNDLRPTLDDRLNECRTCMAVMRIWRAPR